MVVDQKKSLALKLFEISGDKLETSINYMENHFILQFPAFKFGEFTLKSGEISPIYFDLRVIVSYPDVMDQLTDLMMDFIKNRKVPCDQLCGVPYTGEE